MAVGIFLPGKYVKNSTEGEKENVSMFFISFPQLPGRLFRPSDIRKKLSHHFLLYFWIDIGSYDLHTKYQGVFPDLLENTFYIRELT